MRLRTESRGWNGVTWGSACPEEPRVITVSQIAPGSVGHGDNEFLIPDLWMTMFSRLTTHLQNFSAELGASLSPMTMLEFSYDTVFLLQ